MKPLRPVLLFLAPTLPATAQAAESAASAAAGSLLQVFAGLVAVLGLIAGLAWLARRMGLARTGASALLHVVGSASLGTRERVVVLEIGESWLVVGVGAGTVSALATLPKGDVPARDAAPLPPFAARLQGLLEKRRV